MKFYLTFGQNSPFKNGWVSVFAPSYEDARKLIFQIFSKKWAMLYEEGDFQSDYFPEGELGIIK